MWNYNQILKRWSWGSTTTSLNSGYGFRLNTHQWTLEGEPVDKTQVPSAVRNSLEDYARSVINHCVRVNNPGQVQPYAIPLTQAPPRPINEPFEQGEGWHQVALDNETVFGSEGATSCLILFILIPQGSAGGIEQYMVLGAHVDDVWNLDQNFFNPPFLDARYGYSTACVGGEVGANRDNANPELTMDYSSYAPFFMNWMANHLPINAWCMPSNNANQVTNAAIYRQPNNHRPLLCAWHQEQRMELSGSDEHGFEIPLP